MPLSQTSIRTLSPARRQPSRIHPIGVSHRVRQQIAQHCLEHSLVAADLRVRNGPGATATPCLQRNRGNRLPGIQILSVDREVALRRTQNSPPRGDSTSSRLDRMLDMVSRDRAIPPTRSRPSPSGRCGSSAACRNLSVCNGCRRSWLAADRKLDFARSANAADFQAREISSSNRLRSVMSVVRPLMHTGFPAESTVSNWQPAPATLRRARPAARSGTSSNARGHRNEPYSSEL